VELRFSELLTTAGAVSSNKAANKRNRTVHPASRLRCGL